MAPVIVVPPGNRSVVAGSSEVTLECIANARYAAGAHVGTRTHSDSGGSSAGLQPPRGRLWVLLCHERSPCGRGAATPKPPCQDWGSQSSHLALAALVRGDL